MKSRVRSIASLTLGFALALCWGSLACGEGVGDSSWRDLPASEALALLRSPNPPLFLDVRTAREFDQGHIPGALNIPHDEIGARLEEIRTRGKHEIVVFCERGTRARRAAEALSGQELGQLYHLVGDMSGWRRHGYPLTREAAGERTHPEPPSRLPEAGSSDASGGS